MANSRRTGLQEKIVAELKRTHPDLSQHIDITVQTLGGARIVNILSKMDARFQDNLRYDFIYTFVGVNNITFKVGKGKVVPAFESLPELIEELTDKYTTLKGNLKNRANKVVISQIVGIDIDKYNGYYDQGRWFYYQKEVDTAMPILVHAINFINKSSNVMGPWITGSIHDYVNHKLYSRYAKLKNGLHPTESTRNVWAKRFVEAIIKNVML